MKFTSTKKRRYTTKIKALLLPAGLRCTLLALQACSSMPICWEGFMLEPAKGGVASSVAWAFGRVAVAIAIGLLVAAALHTHAGRARENMGQG